MAVALVATADAHPLPQFPLAELRIVQRQGAAGALRVTARIGPLHVVPVPGVTGARVRFTADPGGRDSGVVELPPGLWRGERVLRYEDRSATRGGIARVVLRSHERGWTMKVNARGDGRPLDLAGASRVTFTIDFGEARWCGEVTSDGIRERRRLFAGRSLRPMDSCPCDPLPADTFAAIEQRIFARHTCTALVCHGGVPGRANLTLVSGLAYDSLVGVASTLDSSVVRVEPGEPETSMLLLKVTGGVLQNPSWGMPMPISGRGLDANEVEALRLWIADGAPRTGTVGEAHALLSCQAP